ncbi:ubiquitin-conjugating enzyme family protein [Artemisia annua]|uniref:Ubiquitin-conjugating enzyme family protein n=1 Tax=Artemisia annua TaxID=35608 RepID=A0A2U1NF73_ARTAN|nr:ubiquitin-conjugating enzyme family protein [Artemisia annua]
MSSTFIDMDDDTNNVVNKKRKKISRDPRTEFASVACRVIKVMIEDGMKVEKGQPLLVWRDEVIVSKSKLPTIYEGQPFLSEVIPSSRFSQLPPLAKYKSRMKKNLKKHDSRVGKYSVEDVSMDQTDADNSPMASLSDKDVLERLRNFKKFGTIMDYSDHLFSAQTSPTELASQPGEVWKNKIREEWRILEKDLPETMFVRVYELRMDLLRVAIIGPEGTPYHDGLFFFDLFFPNTYPKKPPLVRYHSGGLVIHPHVFKCGEVCLRYFTPIDCERNKMWENGTSNMLQLLVSMQDLILNSKPFFSGRAFPKLRNSMHREKYSLLYNETILIKSLKTMMYTMNKPPKNFEDLVAGHFRKQVSSILKACEAYTEGVQVGGFGKKKEGNKETCSIEFKNDVAEQIKPLVASFKKIGATMAEDFLHLSEKKASLLAAKLAPTLVLKKNWGNRKRSKCLNRNFNAFTSFVVDKVFVKEGMKVKRGQPLYSKLIMTKKDDTMAISSSSTQADSKDYLDTSSLSELPTISKPHKSMIDIPQNTPDHEVTLKRHRNENMKVDTQVTSSLIESPTTSEPYKSMIHIHKNIPDHEDSVKRFKYENLEDSTHVASSLMELAMISECYKSMVNIPKNAPDFEDAMEKQLYKRLKVDPVMDH